MQATGWIAIYAAAVSTGSLGWQVWNASRARRPQVTVFLETWRTSKASGPRLLWDAKISIRNREDYAVQVDKIHLVHPGQLFGPHIPAAIVGGELPLDVPAREGVSLTIRPEGLFPFPRANQSRNLFPRVVVMLRTGERYKGWRSLF